MMNAVGRLRQLVLDLLRRKFAAKVSARLFELGIDSRQFEQKKVADLCSAMRSKRSAEETAAMLLILHLPTAKAEANVQRGPQAEQLSRTGAVLDRWAIEGKIPYDVASSARMIMSSYLWAARFPANWNQGNRS